jgi:hypothetical protein
MINHSCRHYRGSKPCEFNKTDGSECPSCVHVSEFKERILFIKLDAIGDVLRSASLLPAIIERHNAPYIAWLTRKESIELVGMMKYVNEVIELSEVGLARITTGGWDHVYSLSNDWPSASLATAAQSRAPPVGYYVEHGKLKPSNPAAEVWLEMAAFDRLKRQNKETYQRRMLAILESDGSRIPGERPPRLGLTRSLRAAPVDGLQSTSGPEDAGRRRCSMSSKYTGTSNSCAGGSISTFFCSEALRKSKRLRQ